MMEILNRYPVYKPSILFSIILFLTILAIIVAAIDSVICLWYLDKPFYKVVMDFLIAGCLIMILSVTPREKSTGVYRYEVIFEDDEYINATKGRYNIVGKVGHVYILEDGG